MVKGLKKEVPIVLTTDNNFVCYLLVTLESIIRNANNVCNYDIYIIHDGLLPKYEKIIKDRIEKRNNFSVNFIDVFPYIKDYSLKSTISHVSNATFYRYFIPQLLPQCEKVIYLDTDTIVNCDLEELFDKDIKDSYFGACHDIIIMQNFHTGYNTLEYFQEKLEMDKPCDQYFQAGVLLFNNKTMRRDDICKSMLDIASRGGFLYSGQDPMNLAAKGNVAFLPLTWNYTNFFPAPKSLESIPEKYYTEFRSIEKPKIIHYASFEKPWNKPLSFKAEVWWKYAFKTSLFDEILAKNESFLPISKLSQLKKMNYGQVFLSKIKYKLDLIFCQLMQSGIIKRKEYCGDKYDYYLILCNILKELS